MSNLGGKGISLPRNKNIKCSPSSSPVHTMVCRSVITISLLPHLPVNRCLPLLFIKQPDTQSLTSLLSQVQILPTCSGYTLFVYFVKQKCLMWIHNYIAHLLCGCRQIWHRILHKNGGVYMYIYTHEFPLLNAKCMLSIACWTKKYESSFMYS